MAEDAEPIGIPLVYAGLEDSPVLWANNFVVQYQPDEFTLTFGQLVPPMLIGTEEEQRAQARQLSYVPIQVVGRFALTRGRLEQLNRLLTEHLARFPAPPVEEKQDEL